MTYQEIQKPALPTINWDDTSNFWDESDLTWDSNGYADIEIPTRSVFFSATFYPFISPHPFQLGEYIEIIKPTL